MVVTFDLIDQNDRVTSHVYSCDAKSIESMAEHLKHKHRPNKVVNVREVPETFQNVELIKKAFSNEEAMPIWQKFMRKLAEQAVEAENFRRSSKEDYAFEESDDPRTAI